MIQSFMDACLLQLSILASTVMMDRLWVPSIATHNTARTLVSRWDLELPVLVLCTPFILLVISWDLSLPVPQRIPLVYSQAAGAKDSV